MVRLRLSSVCRVFKCFPGFSGVLIFFLAFSIFGILKQRQALGTSTRLWAPQRRTGCWTWASSHRSGRSSCKCPGEPTRASGRLVRLVRLVLGWWFMMVFDWCLVWWSGWIGGFCQFVLDFVLVMAWLLGCWFGDGV